MMSSASTARAILEGCLSRIARVDFVKRTACLAVAGLASLSLSSSGALSAAAQRNPWTEAGVLREGILIEPGTLNPIIGTGVVESRMQNLIFSGLIRIDDRGRSVPDLAKAIPTRANGGISGDGKTITYHLAENARWSDGEPVTADDVVFTWQALMNPNNRVGGRYDYEQINEITTPDPHTIRVRLKRVYAPAIYLFNDGNQGAIVPKHLLAKYPDVNTLPFNSAPIGSGPYVLREWRHGDRLVFEPNPKYFGKAPKIKKIIVKVLPDSNTLFTQLRTHEIDATDDLDPDRLARAREITGTATRVASGNGFRHLAFNTARPPLDDARVRRALCYAIDLDTIYQKVYFGIGLRAPLDQNPATGWADPAVKYYPHDLKRAAALLDEAGWKLGADGIRAKSSERLSITIVSVTGAKANEQIEVMLQSMWREIGVDLAIKNFPGATLFAPIGSGGITESGNFDVALFSYFRNPDPNDIVLFGPDSIPPAGRNVTRYANAEAGRLQEEAIGTFDSAKRHELYNKLQRIYIRDVPYYTLVWVPLISVFNSDLHGVKSNPLYIDFWNITEWRI